MLSYLGSCFGLTDPVGFSILKIGIMDRLRGSRRHWVHTWTAMPLLTEPDNLPPKPFVGSLPFSEHVRVHVWYQHLLKAQDTVIFPDTTIRQTIRITIGTEKFLRLRFSNAFGSEPVTITETTIALPANGLSGTSTIRPDSLQPVSFDGFKKITISTGAQAISDPIDFGFPLRVRTVLSVSIFLGTGQLRKGGVTSHPGSRTTSFFSLGNHVSDTDLTDVSVMQEDHW